MQEMSEEEFAMCFNKHKFPTRSHAQGALRRLERNGSGRSSIYRCRFCGGWHVGRLRKIKGVKDVSKSIRKDKSWRSEIGSA